MMKRLIVITLISSLAACGKQSMQFTPVGADILAQETCKDKGGVEKFAAYGEEDYLTSAKLHVFCKDSSKWTMEYSKSNEEQIKELVDLRYDNTKLKIELREAEHRASVCPETSDDK